MKIDKKSIVFFFVLALLVVYKEYVSTSVAHYKLPSKSILYLDEKIFKLYANECDVKKDINHYWGFAKEKSASKTSEENATKELITKVVKEDGKNVLCILSSCYRLLGIHTTKEKPFVTLYNKNLKEKVRDYSEGEELEKKIVISSISSHKVFIKELNSSRDWEFKLFDINQTKYIPKETQE